MDLPRHTAVHLWSFDSCDQEIHGWTEYQIQQFEESGIIEMLLSFKIKQQTNPVNLSSKYFHST